MEKQLIWKDAERIIEWLPGSISVTNLGLAKTMSFPVKQLVFDAKIQPVTVAALKEIGKDPADYRVMWRLGKQDLVAPVAVAEATYKEGHRLEAEQEAEYETIRQMPVNKDRSKIEALYATAARIENSDSDDNVMIPAQLRQEARILMSEWRINYPDAAKEEDRRELLAKAASARRLADGALTYDADGWISPDERQKRYGEYIRQAVEIEKQAENI